VERVEGIERDKPNRATRLPNPSGREVAAAHGPANGLDVNPEAPGRFGGIDLDGRWRDGRRVSLHRGTSDLSTGGARVVLRVVHALLRCVAQASADDEGRAPTSGHTFADLVAARPGVVIWWADVTGPTGAGFTALPTSPEVGGVRH
jgi:hypothetical protein